MAEKVNEFLREISPMREVKFWHDFIARFLSPNTPTASSNNTADCNGTVNLNRRRAKPPPLPPKPKLFKPLQPAKPFSSPSIVITPNTIDSRGNQRVVGLHQTSTVSNRMGAINGATEVQNGFDSVLTNGTNSNKSTTSDVATLLGTVDSNNNNTTQDKSPGSEEPEELSFSAKKDLFLRQSSSSPAPRTPSESQLNASFERSNSVPGFSSSQPSQQMSPLSSHFASSAFYDPRAHPTIEEQVNLCREIAKQLVSDVSNAKSKGREMFERRVEKSSNWVTENEDSFQNFSSVQEDYHERTISEGPPNLRLLLDPRHVEDINTVQGVNEHLIAAQEEQTRDTCKHIVQDLTSPADDAQEMSEWCVNPNRGNALFAKRVQKSEEWIIDDVAEQVIDAARDKIFRNVKYNSVSSSPVPFLSAFSSSRYSSPIAGPTFTPVASSLPASRPSSAMGSVYSRYRDFNSRPKPFCRAY